MKKLCYYASKKYGEILVVYGKGYKVEGARITDLTRKPVIIQSKYLARPIFIPNAALVTTDKYFSAIRKLDFEMTLITDTRSNNTQIIALDLHNLTLPRAGVSLSHVRLIDVNLFNPTRRRN